MKIEILPIEQQYLNYVNYHLLHPSGDPLHPTPQSMDRTFDEFKRWMGGYEMIYYPPFKVKIGEEYSLEPCLDVSVMPKPISGKRE